jgi:N-acetylmuramoyl-L-alanine amidase
MTKAALVVTVLVALAAVGAAGEPRVPAAGFHARLRPVVVLDAGHGGSNPGATGSVDGMHEKELTLAIATEVASLLDRRGIEVHLTRDRDRTLTLRSRVAEANRIAADLFVSIHANASDARTQRGFETFVLTPRGVDVDARALRAATGTPRTGVDAATAMVLDDVERGAAQWEAADLAAEMQAQLEDVRGKSGNRGVRQDQQQVLVGATMPAVLVEVGFIDHPIEGREIVEPATRSRLALAIADAISAQLSDAE